MIKKQNKIIYEIHKTIDINSNDALRVEVKLEHLMARLDKIILLMEELNEK